MLRSTQARAVTAALTVLVLAAAAIPAGAAPARPGASEIGDPLFPGLGNGGYDARHYSLSLRYPTAAPVQSVSGVVRMDAVATQKLSSFDLDFAGDSVAAVTVNGSPAAFSREGEDIVIAPRRHLGDGKAFSAEVAFTSHTNDPAGNAFRSAGSRPPTAPSRPASPTSPTRSTRSTTTPPTRRPTASGSTCPPA